jgi:hypothetical protein
MAKVTRQTILSQFRKFAAKKKPKAKAKKTKAEAKAKAVGVKAAKAPGTGRCTITAAGVTVVKTGVTKPTCAAVANAAGGTYKWVADKE